MIVPERLFLLADKEAVKHHGRPQRSNAEHIKEEEGVCGRVCPSAQSRTVFVRSLWGKIKGAVCVITATEYERNVTEVS